MKKYMVSFVSMSERVPGPTGNFGVEVYTAENRRAAVSKFSKAHAGKSYVITGVCDVSAEPVTPV